MSDKSEATPPLQASVVAIEGSSASDDGTSIKIGFRLANGTVVNATMAADRGVYLMAHTALALGKAAQNRTVDPKVRYIFPAERWEAEPMQNFQTIVLAFRLAGGAELCSR